MTRTYSSSLGLATLLASIALSGTILAADPLTAPAPVAVGAGNTNLLTNPSFEQKSVPLTTENSLTGWEIDFRHGADQPVLNGSEVSVVDDPQQAHYGRQFLRLQPTTREIDLRSPVAVHYDTGLYEISLWARGNPGTIAGFGIPILGATFGSGLNGLDDQWKKFSMIVSTNGLTGYTPWPDQTQLFLGVFQPGARGQTTKPLLDIDDVSLTRLACGLGDAFSDHMVLQRGKPVPIWGWAENPGQKVTLNFNGQSVVAVAGQDGRWRTVLAPMPAGGPYVLSMDGQPAAFDVMVGDVWICSGQSNMEFGIDLLDGYYNHAPEVVAEANNPMLRLWQAPKQFSAVPMLSYRTHQASGPSDYQARWDVCTPDTVIRGVWGGFSAVGYFFGREIQEDQHVAVGLMMIANGGTPIESFISPDGLRGIPQSEWIVPPIDQEAKDGIKNPVFATLPPSAVAHSVAYDEVSADHLTPNSQVGSPDQKSYHYASAVSNSLLSPVVPFAVRGVLWYQGEQNGGDIHYEDKLKALIADWRSRFGQKDLPFIVAQLPSWRTADTPHWELIREAQLHVTQTVPDTALAVTIDLADKDGDGYGVGEIHPKRKLEVGQRMALAARALVYGEKLVSSGPTFKSLKIVGSQAIITFASTGAGLTAKDGKIVGFQIAGGDEKFVAADDGASIVGNTIVLSSSAVPSPVAVRYGFAQYMLPAPSLYNKDGLPASPFRTDTWPDN